MLVSKELLEKQFRLEEESVQLGVKRYREQVRNTPVSEMPPGLALMYRTIEPFAKALQDFVERTGRGGARTHQTRDFLKQLDYHDTAYIVSKLLINQIAQVKNIQTVAQQVFDALADHMEYLKILEQYPNYLEAIEKRLNQINSGQAHRRTTILHAKRHRLGIEDTDWSSVDKTHVGTKIIEIFIESTGLVERVQGENSQWLLQGTPEAIEWIIKHHARCELLSPVFLPMVVPPVPWEGMFGGGFLTNHDTWRVPLVRTTDRKALAALEEHDMPEVYKAINSIQNVAWRINTDVLKVLQEVHRLDNGLAGLPRAEEIPLPPTPWTSDEEFEHLKEHHPEVVNDWRASAREVYQRRIQERSKLLQLAHKLWLAEKFQDEERIYFVWTMDFRGRMYPVQTFLTPQGDDVAKGLLEFADGKPLGERGVYWLKVHLANCYGVDKVSFDDRVAWVEEHHDLILDSARNPLGGQRFWAEADEPWQFLAGCFEYLGFTEQGYDFVSHLPIAMDGSCNGLQHFSAMLLDEVGGKATNLVPMDKPQDVYTEVMKVVIEKVNHDAEHGKDAETREMARLWKGKIDRDIVKRPVMTVPYGVKLYGIKDQLVQELRKRDISYLDCEDPYKPCVYLANVLWESIGEVVVASRKAMDWLQEVAGIASKVSDDGIRWVTPAGFLVHQRYAKQQAKTIRTFWGASRVRVQLTVNTDTDKLDKVRQRNGISPNFVHSLDASHLMTTINMLRDIGVDDFVAVHDSYATHASNVDSMHQVLRKAFVRQYSQLDVLADFKMQIENQLRENSEEAVELPDIPPKGMLDIQAVADSLYFFA